MVNEAVAVFSFFGQACSVCIEVSGLTRMSLSAAKPQPKCATTGGPGPIPEVERRRPRRRQTPSSLASSGDEPSPLQPFRLHELAVLTAFAEMTLLSKRKEVDREWYTPSVHRAVRLRKMTAMRVTKAKPRQARESEKCNTLFIRKNIVKTERERARPRLGIKAA